jgi:acetyltransferase-like isoleucine patch superfamily enzyme
VLDTVRIDPGTIIPDDAQIEDYVVIGLGPNGDRSSIQPTRIGSGPVIRSHSVIYAGVVIGSNFHAGHGTLIREHCEFGDNVSVGSGTVIEHHVRIGENVRIHSQTFIPEFTELKDGCWIGPKVTFTNAKFPNSPAAKESLSPATVDEGAIVGAHATIMPGVTIGARALVGAAAVVTRDVPPGKVVVGNPARIVNDVADIPEYNNE